MTAAWRNLIIYYFTPWDDCWYCTPMIDRLVTKTQKILSVRTLSCVIRATAWLLSPTNNTRNSCLKSLRWHKKISSYDKLGLEVATLSTPRTVGPCAWRGVYARSVREGVWLGCPCRWPSGDAADSLRPAVLTRLPCGILLESRTAKGKSVRNTTTRT